MIYFIFFCRYGYHLDLHVLTHSFPTRRSCGLIAGRRRHDGKPGPGQQNFGVGDLKLKMEMARLERWHDLKTEPKDTKRQEWLKEIRPEKDRKRTRLKSSH